MSVKGDTSVEVLVHASAGAGDADKIVPTQDDTDDHKGVKDNVKRARSASVKGKAYQQELLLQRRKSHHKRLLRQLTLVAQCLESTSVEMVNLEASNMDRIFSELVDTNLKYSDLQDEDEEKEVCRNWIEAADNVVFAMKTKVCTWLREQDNNDAGSQRSGRSSQRSGRSHDSEKSRDSRKTASSQRSHRSNRSDHSNASSTHSVQNKAHLAGLKVEMKTMERNWKSTLENKISQFQQSEESQMKERLSKLKEEIAVTEAKQEVYEDETMFLEEDTEKKVIPVSETNREKLNHKPRRKRSSSMFTYRVEQTKEELSHRAKSNDRSVDAKVRKQNVHFNEQRQNNSSSSVAELSQAVIDMMMLNSAPNVELDVFSGKILEFEYFKANFKEMVENKVKDQRGRLARLLRYTSGDAKDLIKGCVHEDSDECYDRAMSLLNKEYGDLHETTCAYLKELHKWPSIRSNDAKGYKSLYRFLLKCQSFKNNGRLAELDSTDMIRMILSNFGTPVQETWNRNACKIREKDKREANFNDLVSFIDIQSRLLNNPSYSRDAFGSNVKLQDSYKSLLTQVVPDNQEKGSHVKPCLCCGDGNHLFEDCPVYLTKTLVERRKFIFQNKLCFSCLAPTSANHYAKICQEKKTCRTCSQPHPTCLHFSVSSIRQPNTGGVTSLPIIPVMLHHKNNPEQCIKVYAMLDEGSQGTFVKESVLHSLSAAPKRNATITVETLNGTDTSSCTAIDGLIVTAIPEHQNKYHSGSAKLPTCYTQDVFPIDVNEIPSPGSLVRWPYLTPISKCLYKHEDSVPVGLLIGANCPKVLEPHEVIPSQGDGPYAYRSCLGWCIVGPLGLERSDAVQCNAIALRVPVKDASTNAVASHHFALTNAVKECAIRNQLNEMYMHDFNEVQPEKKAMSAEDVEFLRRMNEGIAKEDDGHYSLPLPFRNSDVSFPNNRVQAVSRAEGSLKKKMKRDEKFRAEYTDFMKNIFDEGYAKKVVSSKKDDTNANVWYIPHHAVYHPTKGKIRVVFDCAARFKGKCLNDELLQGPDLANLIIGVLIRFRKEEVAVQADLTGMFFQVFVPNHHQKFLRFVFWPDGNIDADLEDYQMCVHLFGAKSSTSCCIYALRRTASDNKDKYSKEACETVAGNFYIDDLLKSYPNDEVAVAQSLELIELCKEGGFSLSKFVSNSQTVMDVLPEEKKASSVREMDIGNTTQIERALGVLWYVENDTLGFRISMENTPLTRRGMLSTISSAFDPFGGAGPFLIKGKRILQLVNSEKKSWDDPVSNEHASAWQQWRQELLDLRNLVVNRCYKPKGFGKATHCSLHCFSDASDLGYGQVTYLRQENGSGDVSVVLVMGKARVAPLKVTTIPRLELVAATVSVKVAALVKEEIKVDGLKNIYYTDSEIVLGYISNEVKRFRTFVANRVQTIRTYTEVDLWRHVSSKENPADLASRGIAVKEEDKVRLWLYGPEFLKGPKDQWKDAPPIGEIDDDDPEVKKNLCVLSTKVDSVNDHSVLTDLEERISSWEKMVRVLAYILKFIAKCRKVVGVSALINTNDFDLAEKMLSRLIQQRSYAGEISVYQNSTSGRKKAKTRLWQLDPFLDENGLLRVGGRLGKSGVSDHVKHPVILPSKAVATRRLVQSCHQKVQHSGRTTTVSEIRESGFWIVNINSCVRNIIYNCVHCRMFRGKLAVQKMADLPDYRTSTEGPFVHTGVDMFGPFFVKEKRSQVKRYVAMFTCLSSRAVHLETTKDMSADSFIQALRRFLARRGTVKSIRSDNGTNFVGAETELRKGWEEMDHQKIGEFLLSRKCDWIDWERNPPAASHMGGVWERQIRTIRNIMTSLLKDHAARLDDESLRTLLCEAECIVNSRPLTPESVSDVSSEVLTPNHLLTMKSKVVLSPPGDFQKEDMYCRKRWRAVQYLANQFWTRWRKEYLSILQQRNKWSSPKRNFQVDDVVLVKEENSPRNQWPMGRVLNVLKNDHDGLVRTVDVYCSASNTNLRRPIHKLVLLVGADEDFK